MEKIFATFSKKYLQKTAIAGEQQGIRIEMPDPTYIDAYKQFFKNIYFVMMIVTILIVAGCVAEEKSRGTVYLVLTKCLSRTRFIIGKLISSVILFTLSYALSSAICVYYTYLLFNECFNMGIFMAFILFWVFGVFMVTVTILASTLSKSLTVAAVGGFAGYALVNAAASLPYISKYSPGILQGLSTELAMAPKRLMMPCFR